MKKLKSFIYRLIFAYLVTNVVMSFTGSHSDREIYLAYFLVFQGGFSSSGFGMVMDYFTYILTVIGLSINAIYAFSIFLTVFLMLHAFRFLKGGNWAILLFVLISSESGNLFGNVIRHGLAGALILYSYSLQTKHSYLLIFLSVAIHLSAAIYLPFLLIANLSRSSRFVWYSIMMFATFVVVVITVMETQNNSIAHVLINSLQYVFGDSLLTVSNLSYAPTYVLYRFYSAGLLVLSLYWFFVLYSRSLPRGNIPTKYIELMLVGNLVGLLAYFLFFGIGATGRILLVPIFFSTVMAFVFLWNLVRPLLIPLKEKRDHIAYVGETGGVARSA